MSGTEGVGVSAEIVFGFSGGKNRGFFFGIPGVGGGVKFAKMLVLIPCFGIWGPGVWAIVSSSLIELGWTTLTLLPAESRYRGGGAIGDLDMSDCDPSSYFTDLLKVTGGVIRFGLPTPFLKELFRGGGLLLSGKEVLRLSSVGDGFCFFSSAALIKLSLALRLRLPLLCAISDDCKVVCD
jgi:hypothetical protein